MDAQHHMTVEAEEVQYVLYSRRESFFVAECGNLLIKPTLFRYKKLRKNKIVQNICRRSAKQTNKIEAW